jgi:hypothetical protein
MTKTEVDYFLKDWWSGSGKIFRYIREFMPDEYVLIYKRSEDSYIVDPTSTYKLKDMNADSMCKMLQSRDLVHYTDSVISKSCRDIKTGGCDCGGWAVGNKHAFGCKIWYKNG